MSRHAIISYFKSVLRLVGYVVILIDIKVAVGILVASEIVGIIEEIGH